MTDHQMQAIASLRRSIREASNSHDGDPDVYTVLRLLEDVADILDAIITEVPK